MGILCNSHQIKQQKLDIGSGGDFKQCFLANGNAVAAMDVFTVYCQIAFHYLQPIVSVVVQGNLFCFVGGKLITPQFHILIHLK